jgi:hypothetical protein
VVAPSEASNFESVYEVLLRVVNVNLEGLMPRLGLERLPRAGLPDGLAPALGVHFRSLLEVMYWHLARVVAGAEDVRAARCEECQRPFVRTHGRERFCPPLGPEKASLCSGRARARRSRQKSRTADAPAINKHKEEPDAKNR